MSRPKNFKSLDDLSARDFEKHPVWGFDLDMGESVPGADETWVRPFKFSILPRSTDSLFVRAELTTSEGVREPGLLCLRYERGTPLIEGVALWNPDYTFLGLQGDRLNEFAMKQLRENRPDLLKKLPLAYAATLLVGSNVRRFSGAVNGANSR